MKQQLGSLIESRADAVEYGRDMLAHRGPVEAAARKLDLSRRGKQPRLRPADALHDTLGEATLQQFHQRIDGTRAILADRRPPSLGHGRDFHRHPVELRSAHDGADRAGRDAQIDHRSVAHVRASPWQAVREIAVALEVVAPGLAPKRSGDRAALDDHRGCRIALLLERLRLPRGPVPARRHGNVRLPLVEHASLLHRGAKIERDKLEQRLVLELGQVQLGAAFEQILRELLL